MAKEAYYFSHDANARHDDKILELRAELGWEGYGLFWAVIETLRDCSNYSYPSNAKAGLALSLNIDKLKLEQFVSTCVKLCLLVEKDGVFYSESLMRRMEEVDEKRRKRAEAGRLGGNAKANGKQSSSNAKAKASKESKGNKSKEKDLYTAKPKDLEMVIDTFKEKGIKQPELNAARFYNFYEANGWVQGAKKAKIVSWKHCINTWKFEKESSQDDRKIIGYVDRMELDDNTRQMVVVETLPVFEGDKVPYGMKKV